jgi:hypothetical protein
MLHHKHFDCNYGAMHVPLDYLPQQYLINTSHSLALAGQVLSVHLPQPSHNLCVKLPNAVHPKVQFLKCFKNSLNLYFIPLESIQI